MSVPLRTLPAAASRVSGFAAVPVLGILGPFLLVPLVTRVAGPEGWTAIASAQAIGFVGATLVQFGWPMTGPAMVARCTAERAADVYYTSVLMRSLLLAIAAPATALLAWALAPPHWEFVSVILAIAFTLPGMSAAWYFVGRSRPAPILLLEVGPRMIGVGVSGALLLLTRQIWPYALTALATEIAIALLGPMIVAKRVGTVRQHFRAAVDIARAQWTLAFAGMASLGYTRAAVPLVAGLSYSSGAVFAACDRLNMLGRSLVRPGVQALQGWVYAPDPRTAAFKRRAKTGLATVAIGGALAAAVTAALVPIIDSVLFGPEIQITRVQAALLAVALLAIWTSSATANLILIPNGRVRVISRSLVSAAAIGIPLLIVATQTWGATGALSIVAGVELYVVTIQLAVAIPILYATDRPHHG